MHRFDGEIGNSHGNCMQDSAKAGRMRTLVLPGRQHTRLNLQGSRRAAAAAFFLQNARRRWAGFDNRVCNYTTDVTLSVTESHLPGDDFDGRQWSGT